MERSLEHVEKPLGIISSHWPYSDHGRIVHSLFILFHLLGRLEYPEFYQSCKTYTGVVEQST